MPFGFMPADVPHIYRAVSDARLPARAFNAIRKNISPKKSSATSAFTPSASDQPERD